MRLKLSLKERSAVSAVNEQPATRVNTFFKADNVPQ
jgi:hypothetical protein